MKEILYVTENEQRQHKYSFLDKVPQAVTQTKILNQTILLKREKKEKALSIKSLTFHQEGSDGL